MKRIGLLGGMSWESPLEYYGLANEEVRVRLGGLHSAGLPPTLGQLAPLEELQRTGRWEEVAELVAADARALVGAGAEHGRSDDVVTIAEARAMYEVAAPPKKWREYARGHNVDAFGAARGDRVAFFARRPNDRDV